MITDFDHRAMGLAHVAIEGSMCEGRVVGCVLLGKNDELLASGTNALPMGSEYHAERLISPGKLKWVEHAERSAIYTAARNGTPVGGATAYSTLFPCCDCARGLIESGVSRVVSYRPDYSDPKWGEDFKISQEMFAAAFVTVDFIDEVSDVS